MKKANEDRHLRNRAEDRLKDRQADPDPPGAPEDAARLLHELQVHQVELEIQNEELVEARKLAEAALEKYTDLYDFAPVGYCVVDANGTVLEANLKAADLVGTERSRFTNRRLEHFLTPESRSVFREFLDALALAETPLAREVALSGEESRIRHVRLDGVAVDSAETKGRAFRIAMTDITDSKRANELQRYELLARNSRDIILFLRREDGHIVEANQAAVNAYGYTHDELLSMTLYDLRAPQDAHRAEMQLDDPDSAGILFETSHLCKDGTTFPVEVSSRGIINDGEGILVNIARDITERRKVLAELQRIKDDLERSNRDLTQFAFAASHDLEAPLRQIVGFVQLIEKKHRGKLDNEAAEYMGFVLDGAMRMQHLIRDLLAWSRAGRRDTEFRPTNIQEALDEALYNLMTDIGESRAVITHDPMPTVNGNQSQLTQVFQNLISNAIKFCKEKPPEIHIGISRNEGCWLFWVRDNGIGFPAESARDIFQMFKRLHSQAEYPGTGIGLAICQKVIEQHGGQICAESIPGEGATFYFTLPAS